MTASQIPLDNFHQSKPAKMLAKAEAFYQMVKTRRTVRDFSSSPIPDGVVDLCIQAAGSAPSGANQQPWHFVVIQDKQLKQRIRNAAEKEEAEFYAGRAGDVWLDTLKPLGTDAEKPFLEHAPVLIAIFEQKYYINEEGIKVKNYYSKESVGIATGLLITALHNSGLVTLTHTPSPMNFLSKLLMRPKGERPFLLLVAGLPAEDATVPAITKKTLSNIRTTL